MELEQVYTRLKSTGIPVAYRAFQSRQELPFIVYLNDGDNNFSADGRVFFSSHQIRVELYTQEKDRSAEAQIEAAFADIFYTKDQIFIDSEGVYETIYEMEV